MYDPTVGRFLNEDPLGFLPDSNPYRYVHNSPTNHVDPTGLIETDPEKKETKSDSQENQIGQPIEYKSGDIEAQFLADADPGVNINCRRQTLDRQTYLSLLALPI